MIVRVFQLSEIDCHPPVNELLSDSIKLRRIGFSQGYLSGLQVADQFVTRAHWHRCVTKSGKASHCLSSFARHVLHSFLGFQACRAGPVRFCQHGAERVLVSFPFQSESPDLSGAECYWKFCSVAERSLVVSIDI